MKVQEIKTRLNMNASTFQKSGISLNYDMPANEAIEFLQKRTKAGGRWSEEQASAARGLLAEVSGANFDQTAFVMQTAKPEPKQKQEPKPKQPLQNWFIRFVKESPEYVVLTVLFGIAAQLIHTYRFVSETLQSSLAESLFVSVAFDLTAFTMTIRTNNKAYLIAFAMIHFVVNCSLYSKEGLTMNEALLSAVVAFANYSYSELFNRISK